MVTQPGWRTIEVPLNLHVSLTLGELVDGWLVQVRRFTIEMDSYPDDRRVWAAHDFIGALHLRDALERGLDLVSDHDREDVLGHLGKADRDFEAFTEPDQAELLKGVLFDEPIGECWWWKRVPTRGPVRDELDGNAWDGR